MNRAILFLSIVVSCVCLQTGPVRAQSPYVYTYDYTARCVGVWDDVFQLQAGECSGTYVTEWWWEYPDGLQLLSESDGQGYYSESTASFRAVEPGRYHVYAYAENEYQMEDHDYTVVYAFLASIDSWPNEIPYQGSAEIAYDTAPTDYAGQPPDVYMYITDSSEQTVRTFYLGHPDGYAYLEWDGTNDDDEPVQPGVYTFALELYYSDYSLSSSCQITVTEPATVAITTPSTFPAYVAKNSALQLDCTPSPTGGSYTWSQIGGTGTGTFSNRYIKSPTFTGTSAGTCTLQVQYTPTSGSAVTSSSVTVIVIDLTINTPPAYAAVNSYFQLSTTPLGATDGVFDWHASGPGDFSFTRGFPESPQFSAHQYGPYTIEVSYTKGSASVTKTIGSITVIDLAVTTSFPATAYVNFPLSLACTPQGSSAGTYSWTKASGPGNVTFSPAYTAQNPTFSADQVGTYTIQVSYSLGSATVTKGPLTINVLAPTVTISTPVTFPAYIAKNSSIQLDCTPWTAGGTYTWSQVAGSGAGTFSDIHAKNPVFTGTQGGPCTIQVQYAANGVTVSDTKSPVNVVDVTINGTFPDYVSVNTGWRIMSASSAIEGGTYTWSKDSGPGTMTFSTYPVQSPSFSVSAPGEYKAKVEYTVGGITVSATSGSIYAITFDVIAGLPGLMKTGQVVQLDCNPSVTGGTYTWHQVNGTGSGTFSDLHAKNTTFTATGAGQCDINVDYTIASRTFSVSAGTPTIVDLVVYPSFPAFAMGLNDSATLDVAQSGGPDGQFSWTQLSGPGNISFSPSAEGEEVTLSASAHGEYMLRVSYDCVGGVLTKDVGPLTFVGLAVDPPFPLAIDVNHPLQLNTTLQGTTGCTYAWTKLSGPGNVTFSDASSANPTFSADQPGDYTIQVACTKNGLTVAQRSGSISVIGVSIGQHAEYWPYQNPTPASISYSITPSDLPFRCGVWLTITDSNNAVIRTVSLGDALGQRAAQWDGKKDDGTWAPPGTCTATVGLYSPAWGSAFFSASCTIDIVAVRIVGPSSFPIYAMVNDVIQFDCAPSLMNGRYAWSQVGGTGAGAFSDPAAKNPTFKVTQAGSCNIAVEYTEYAVHAVRVADTAGLILASENTPQISLTCDRCFRGVEDGMDVVDIQETTNVSGTGGVWRLAVLEGYDPENVVVYDGYLSFMRFSFFEMLWPGVPISFDSTGGDYVYAWPVGQRPSGGLRVSFVNRARLAPPVVLKLSYSSDGITEAASATITVQQSRTLLNIADPEHTPLYVTFNGVICPDDGHWLPDRMLDYRGFRLNYDAASAKWVAKANWEWPTWWYGSNLGTNYEELDIEGSCTSEGKVVVRVVSHLLSYAGTTSTYAIFDSGEDQKVDALPQCVYNSEGGMWENTCGECAVALWDTPDWNPLSSYEPGDRVAYPPIDGGYPPSVDGFTEVYTCMVAQDPSHYAIPGTDAKWYLGSPKFDEWDDENWGMRDIGISVGGPPVSVGFNDHILARVVPGGWDAFNLDNMGDDFLTPPQGSIRMTIIRGSNKIRIWKGSVGTAELILGAGSADTYQWWMPDLFAGLEAHHDWSQDRDWFGYWCLGDTAMSQLSVEAVALGPAIVRVEYQYGSPWHTVWYWRINASPQVRVCPDEPIEVAADDGSIVLVAEVTYVDGSPVEDGSTITWYEEGWMEGQWFLLGSTQTEGGYATAVVSTNTYPSTTSFAATLTSLVTDGVAYPGWKEPYDNAVASESALIRVVPGEPAVIQMEGRDSYTADDGMSTGTVTAIVHDAWGNPVPDGTPVSWAIETLGNSGDTDLVPLGTGTANGNGHAWATVRSSLFEEGQVVTATAGRVSASHTVNVVPIELTLDGPDSLDIADGQEGTLTLRAGPQLWYCSVPDGVPVTWFVSNGCVDGSTMYETTLLGGTSAVTLSSKGGRVGSVTVIASVFNSVAMKTISFTSSAPTYLQVEHPVIIGDATEDGITDNGVSYYAKTKVHVHGTAGAVAKVWLGDASTKVASYDMEEITSDNKVEDTAGDNDAAVGAGVTQDTSDYEGGSASFHFNGSGNARLTIPHCDALDIADGLSIQFYLRPEVIGSATLVQRSDKYALAMDSSGLLTFSVQTDAGSYSVTSTSPLEVEHWYYIDASMNGGRLSLMANGTTANTCSGQITVDSADTIIGSGLNGNIDSLSFSKSSSSASGLVALSGVGSDGSIVLDEDGHAELTVTSLGAMTQDFYVDKIVINVVASPKSDVEVKVTSKTSWDYFKNMAAGALWGGGEGADATAADFAAGMADVGDIRDMLIELARLWPGGKSPDWTNFGFSVLGLVPCIFPGAGEAVDAPIEAARVVVKRTHGPVRQGTCKVISGMWPYIKGRDLNGLKVYLGKQASFFRHLMGSSDETLNGLEKTFKNSGEFVTSGTRIYEKLGGEGLDAVASVATRHGSDVGNKLARVLNGSSDEVLAALKQGDQLCTEAIEGLAKALKYGVDPALARKIIHNQDLLSATYRQADLLKDIGVVADVPGFNKLARMMQSSNASVHGYRYELEVAAHYKRNGASVTVIDKLVDPAVGRKDIDLIIHDAELGDVYYQVKSTDRAFRSLQSTKDWVAQAMADMTGSASYSRVKYVFPSDADVPSNVLTWLRGIGIGIVHIPHPYP